MHQLIIISTLISLASAGLPVIDKGVFALTGIKTCGVDGNGYCILGQDCTVDKEFIADANNGHCDGLRKAFTPRAFFVCCEFVNQSVVTSSTTVTTIATSTVSTTTEASVEVNSVESGSVEEKSSSEEVPDSDEVVVTTTQQATEEVTKTTVVATTESNDVTMTVAPVTTTSTTENKATVTTTTTEEEEEEEPLITIEKQSSVISTSISSCVGGNSIVSRFESSRLAASVVNSQGQDPRTVCWTGAITRSFSTSALYQSDPGSFICTGALITPTLLLTTATCVSRLFGQIDLSQYKVVLGAKLLTHPSRGRGDGNYREVKELIIHEEYRVKSGLLRVNDIALVRLSPPSENETVCTVCLPEVIDGTGKSDEDYIIQGKECIVSGYSHPTTTAPSQSSQSQQQFNSGGGGGSYGESLDSTLHEAFQKIESSENCSSTLLNYGSINSNNNNIYFRDDLDHNEELNLLCASGRSSAEACFSPRDSGSPLVCPDAHGYFRLQGLFSSGFHCGTVSSPVLYTNVAKNVEWIRKFL